MKRRFFIALGFIIILLITVFFISLNKKNENLEEKNKINDKGELPKKFSSSQLEKAENALLNGIKIEDPQEDWFKFPENSMQWDKPDNSNPYPFPSTDLKEVLIGADENYLYVKYVYYGKFPDKMPSFNGDDIFSTGAKICDMTYITKEGLKDLAELGTGINYVRFTGKEKTEGYVPLDKPEIGQLAMITPIGEDENRETIYKTKNGAGYVVGGSGYNYLLSAFPLREFGLSLGQEISFSIATETGSNKYHHESIDLVPNAGNSKFGATIVYVLGSNNYTAFLTKEEMKK